MKKHIPLLLPLCLLWSYAFMHTAPAAYAETAGSYKAVPPFITSGAPPLVMLVMGRDHKLYYEAYNDASDLNDDGALDIRYNPAIDYYGYFDNHKCYTYSSANSRFEPSSTTTNKKCTSAAADWSGDFLNYLTMSRMDTMRKVLYGGYRSTDSASETVLQRVFIPQDAHSWGKEYESIARDLYDIRDYTPLALPDANTRHLFASTTLSDNGNPLLRVLPNNTHRIWDWVAKERPVVDDSLATAGNYNSYPASHTQYEALVTQFANAAHQQGTGAPANGRIDGSGNPYGADDYYLNIFKGQLVVATADTYEFAVDGDDAVELMIDGTVVASWYNDHGRCSCTTHTGSIYLTSGSHTVEFRQQERSGDDNYYLHWNGADSGDVWEIVPTGKFNNLIQTTYNVNSTSTITDYQVRVKVCDPAIGLETNCQQYPSGNYKPTGLLQRNGESAYDAATSSYKPPRMYFGLMTGSYDDNTSGGVLRRKMGNISDEIETITTGAFKPSVNGIIQTINKLRIYNFNYGDHDYNVNCGWIVSGPMTEGQCRNWGNPIGEIMYESARYFAGKGVATDAFVNAITTDDSNLGLPEDTWNDPYDKADGGFDSCAKPFMLVLSDINPSYDSDQLPGVNTNFGAGITSDLSGLNVSTEAAAISSMEGITGDKFIGQSSNVVDGVCSVKSVTGLGTLRGLCPEEPTKLGSYYSASVAKFAHTTDLNPADGNQKVTTYSIGLASPLPRIELRVGPDKHLVTLVPFGKSVKYEAGGLWTFFPTNTIVDFFVETLGPTSGTFSINYEDVEQGADHDMDAIVKYEYQLVDASDNNVADPLLAAKVKITLTSTYAAGNIVQHLGYIISGTTADQPYLEVRDFDTDAGQDAHTPFDTGSATAPLPLTATRTFTPSSTGGATAAQLLPNPLWYAAKWGAYEESKKDAIAGPNRPEEWDKDSDGVPDTYFYVTNPLKLEEQLSKSFADILRRTTSGTAASVISGSRSGEGAIYQSVFYPEYSDFSVSDNKVNWVGSVHASFVDALGRMREDTPDALGNQNRILDKNDWVIAFKKDTTTNTLFIEKYSLVDAVAERTDVTLPDASAVLAGKYFLLYASGETFYVWFTVDGSGTDPRPSGMTGIRVALELTDNSDAVAIKTASALSHLGATFTVPTPSSNVITITNVMPGDTPDAATGTSGFTLGVVTQGVGETTRLEFTGNAEDIDYLWNSNTWLNNITDVLPDYNITTQRDYSDITKDRRYIFTFIDADQDKVADSGEQLPFVAGASLPTAADLVDAATIYPYIPVSSNSETLPAYPVDDKLAPTGDLVDNDGDGTTDEAGEKIPNVIKTAFLQNQTQRVINYVRGQDQGPLEITYEDPVTHVDTTYTIPAFRSRKLDLDHNNTLETTWRLGDIVYSSPTVVSKPQEALHLLYKDGSYGTFAAQYKQRRTVVYTGANDGMLHAFNGGFYEDRFDVYPTDADPTDLDPNVGDGVRDAQFLLQPKKIISAADVLPVVYGTDTSFSAHPLGAELWAYVPYNLLPHLYWLTAPDYAHVYYVDLKPRIFDAKIFTPDTDHPGGWGTVLVGGMRFGGGKINVDMNRLDGDVTSNDRTMTSAFFILDITNPEVPPTVLGEINFPHLGYTTCYPTVATMKDKVETTGSPNRWFLIFGSGPAEADGSPGTTAGVSLPDAVSNQKAKLYVVDLVELAKEKELKTLNTSGALTAIVPPTPPDPPQSGYYMSFEPDGINEGDNNAFISDPITVDYDLDYKADAVYFGTVSYDATAAGAEWGGKLRRIVMNDIIDPPFWDGDSILVDLEKSTADPISGIYQPISAAPTVGLDPDGNNWVYFGTGRYFLRNDKDITSQQTFYGIKEPKIGSTLANSYGQVDLSTLYDSTLIQVDADTQVVTGGPVPPSGTAGAPKTWNDFVAASKTFKGWFYNFDESLERNLGQAALFGDLTTFTSYVPSNDTCTYEGSSNLYALYYLTGTAPNKTVLYDILQPSPTYNIKKISLGTGLVSKPSIHVGTKEGSTVFVQSSDGSIIPVEEQNPGTTKSGRTAWSQRD